MFLYATTGHGAWEVVVEHLLPPGGTVLIPGTYSIVETVSATWTQSGFVCSDGSSLAALVLSAGETLTCVVTNTRDDSNGGGGSNGGSNGGGGGSSGGGNSGGSNGEGNNSGSQNSTRVADPQPLVLGEATSVMPLGAANTGAGGTALPQVPAPLLVVLAGEAIVKIRLRLGRW